LYTRAAEWNYGIILCEGTSVHRKYRLPDVCCSRYSNNVICGCRLLWYSSFPWIYLDGHYEGLCWSRNVVSHHSDSRIVVRCNIFCIRLCDEYYRAWDGSENKKWWLTRQKLLSIRLLCMCWNFCCIFRHNMLFLY